MLKISWKGKVTTVHVLEKLKEERYIMATKTQMAWAHA